MRDTTVVSRERYFAWGLALIAFGVRLIPWRTTFQSGNIIFGQPDAYYHLRRANIFLHTFPDIPAIDMYMAYPYGAEAPWPPLYDMIIALLTWAIGLGSHSYTILHWVTALLPPVLAGLTVVPVYLVARLLAGTGAAVASSIFFVLIPGHLGYSSINSGDHHTAEAFLLAWFFYLYLRSAGGGGYSVSKRHALGAGAVLGAAVLVWQGSIVFAAILVGGLALAGLSSALRGGDRWGMPERWDAAIVHAAVSLWVAAALVAAGRLLYPSGTEQTVFGFGFFSWFQPFFLGLLFLLVVALGAATRFEGEGGRRRLLRRIGAGLGGGVLLIAVLFLFPWFRDNIADGVRFILTRNPYLESINEFQPTFDRDALRRMTDPAFFPDLLYGITFVLPLVLSSVLFVRRFRRGDDLLEISVYAFWALLIGFLALRQKRWANAYAVTMGIGIGWSLALVYRGNSRVGDLWRDFLAWREARTGEGGGSVIPARLRNLLSSRGALILPSLIVLGLLLIPYYQVFAEFTSRPPRPITSDIYNSLIWLRQNTPKTRNPWNPRVKPEYAVLSSWDYGHWIQYIAERPTVVNNFGYQLRGNGLEDMLRVFYSPKEETVVEVCERRGVRYLFLNDMFLLTGPLTNLIGIDYEKVFFGEPYPHAGQNVYYPSAAFMALPYSRMFYMDGSASGTGPATTRFRLIFESEHVVDLFYANSWTKEIKIFEFVKGAKIEGTCRPGQKVVLSCRLMTNFDRVFEYANIVEADSRGNFAAVFPYSTKARFYGVTPVSRAVAYTETDAVFFDVEERDVLEGSPVRVDLRRGLPGRRHPALGGAE